MPASSKFEARRRIPKRLPAKYTASAPKWTAHSNCSMPPAGASSSIGRAIPAQVCFSEVIMATAYQKDGERRFTNEHANDIRTTTCKRPPSMKEALNKTVSTQRAIAALSLAVFLRFSMPPIPDTSPPFLKGNHAAETLPSNAKSTVSTTSKRLRPHASAL